MVDIKSMAAATAPREFELSYTTTIEDVYEKLNTHASAFKMPFKIKGGIPGKRISFEKEPNLDVTVWVFVKDGNKIKAPTCGIGGSPGVCMGHTCISPTRAAGGMAHPPLRRFGVLRITLSVSTIPGGASL